MNWIECSPEEATRATINGKVLARSPDKAYWCLRANSIPYYSNLELQSLGATFEKEAPQEWVVEFDGYGACSRVEPYVFGWCDIGDALRRLSGDGPDDSKSVRNATFLIRRLK